MIYYGSDNFHRTIGPPIPHEKKFYFNYRLRRKKDTRK